MGTASGAIRGPGACALIVPTSASGGAPPPGLALHQALFRERGGVGVACTCAAFALGCSGRTSVPARHSGSPASRSRRPRGLRAASDRCGSGSSSTAEGAGVGVVGVVQVADGLSVEPASAPAGGVRSAHAAAPHRIRRGAIRSTARPGLRYARSMMKYITVRVLRYAVSVLRFAALLFWQASSRIERFRASLSGDSVCRECGCSEFAPCSEGLVPCGWVEQEPLLLVRSG